MDTKSQDSNNYQDFIAQKHLKSTFEPVPNFESVQLNPLLKDFQVDIVTKALKAGRYAIFADCGMGKTFMQLEWARVVKQQVGGKVLILAPLAVIEQTKEEAIRFGISLDGFTITNYERLEEVSPEDYSAVVLDESSILKNFTGKTKRMLIDMFAETPYRLCCTATPSPNDHTEIGNHSEFLGVIDSKIMKSIFFENDLNQNNVWTLKHWAKNDFWEWVCEWATSIRNPSDLGYSDDGYILPELKFINHSVDVKSTRKEGLFEDIVRKDVNATQYHKTLRDSMAERMGVVKKIVDSEPDRPWIIWVKQNEESSMICKMIQGSVEVTGSENADVKARKFQAFKNGEIRVLVTKEKIAQFGLNFQHCDRQVFCALGFGFEGFYQAVRRSYRFGQPNPVNVHVISPSNMENVSETIDRKMRDFLAMQKEMAEATKRIHMASKVEMIDKPESISTKSEKYEIILGDCVEECAKIEDNSVDIMVFSPPFSSLYTYSESIRDMGNCFSNEEFIQHYKFLAKELLRILRPGRVCCVHVRNLNISKQDEGVIGLYDLRGDLIRAMNEVGFVFQTEVTVWTNPVVEMQRTKHIGLLYREGRKDWSVARMGRPDNIIVFRKWEGVEDSDLVVKVNQCPDDFPVDMWQQWASPVWFDINMTNVLNGKAATGYEDERHICPLQLDVIQRCVRLWSNPNELVFSPFAGIGSEGYQSILEGRRFLGVELKEAYYNQAIKYLNRAVMQTQQLGIFDLAVV